MLASMLISAFTLIPIPNKVTVSGGVCSDTNVLNKVVFSYDDAIPREGYRLSVSPSSIAVVSSDETGAFYAQKTLSQLCLNDRVPCVVIEDAPAFRWRGFLLDEGRHFFGKETVLHVLDLMADYKLNVFHWHLTEDQGWRLAIDPFPELVEYGAVRSQSVSYDPAAEGRMELNGEKYGPFFYEAEDVREIVAYAKARHIVVVPEIEIPGHTRALLAAHPEFSCRGNLPREPRSGNGIEEDVLCAGNDAAIRYMERVYDAVCDLFPGAYVHIGGDECPKKRWKKCPKCQARMRELGLKDEEALQGWLTAHFTEYLAHKGRHAIGWDEVLDGKPEPNTVIQSWRGEGAAAVKAAEAGHDVVVSSVAATYFSVSQGTDGDPFVYLNPRRRTRLRDTYGFDPAARMPDTVRHHVLGAECCMWSECTWNRFDLDFKMWPRALAFAEAVWTAPERRQDFSDFESRAELHRRRLVGRGVVCAPIQDFPGKK